MQVLCLVILLLSFAARMSSCLRPAALVTGSTDGIGVTTAKNLAARGYDVLIHGRDAVRVARSQRAIEQFVARHSKDPGRVFALHPVDISTVGECKHLAKEVKDVCHQNNLALTVLMNNAGVFEERRIITADGLESTFAVNVVAVFVLTSLLLPLLVKQKSRIVVASSISQCGSIRNWNDLQFESRPYSAHTSYSESKLFDAMLTMEMADRLRKAGIGTDQLTCNCLDPGTVNTKMLLAGWGPCGISVEEALDQTWLCSSDEVEGVTGKYYVYQCDRRASAAAYDQSERDKMWAVLSEISPEAASMWTFDWYSQD